MLKEGKYSSVDELPNLLLAKKTDYKSVDELPDLKKKESSVNGGIGGTVGSGKVQSGVSTDPLANQKKVFSGLSKEPIGSSTPFSTGEVKKEVPVKEDKSVFNPVNNLPKHNLSDLDTQELKEYESRKNAIQTKPQVELIEQIKKERSDPKQQKKLAEDYIMEDMKENRSPVFVDQHGLNVPLYFNNRKQEIKSQIEDIKSRMDERGLVSDYSDPKDVSELNRLTIKLGELNKYSNVYNQQRAISDVNPNLSDEEKAKQIGRNLRKVDELDKVKKEESGEINDKPEVNNIRDFNDELAGINAMQGKVVEDFNNGVIDDIEAKNRLHKLKEQDNKLDIIYPEASLENIRGYLGEDIANTRKQTSENAPANSGAKAGYFLKNVFSAAPDKEEIQASIDRARKNGAKISTDQEKALLKDPDKFALTSMLGHFYKSLIVEPDQAINKILGNDKSGRLKYFNDASVNQMEQPAELPKINSDGKIRMSVNEKAGEKNPLGWGTLNNMADVAGTVMSYAALNNAFGKVADVALGGIAGAEGAEGIGMAKKLSETQRNLASNIMTSTFLNYHHNKEYAKTITDDPAEQEAYALSRSMITGLAFSELNPNKLVSGVSASTEKNIAEKFLEQYKSGKGTLNPDGMKEWFANTVTEIGKDLGHNISTIKADQLAGIALDKLTNKDALENRDIGQEMIGNLPADVLAFAPFSVIVGYKKGQSDAAAKDAVKMAIANPERFEADMNKMVEYGLVKKEDAEQKINYIKDLVKTSGGADMKSERVQALPENDQFSYAANLAKESNLKSKSKDLTDKVQLEEHKREINELADERKAILNGKQYEYARNVELFDRAYEKGTHNQTLDTGTKSEGVQYLAEQALTAPNSFKNQTGRDTELTTDLIALNTKQEIKAEIKAWKDKIKPDGTKAETEAIQKHIDLLEAGLEKNSPKKVEEPIVSEGVVVEPPKEMNDPVKLVEPKAEVAEPEVNPVKIEVPKEIPEPVKLVDEKTETIEVPDTKTGGSDTAPTVSEVTPETTAGEEGGKKVGVSHESLTDLAKKMGLKEPETGEWHSSQWYADRGRQLLEGGADPKETDNPKNELHDRISIARANLENLVKEADKIAREKGVDSDEYKAAHEMVNDYANNVVKKLGTKAGQAMTALQGERDIDTDSFTAVRKAAADAMDGKPLSKEQEAKIKDLVAKNEELKKRADEAERLLIEATDKAMKEGDTDKKVSVKDKAKKTADIIRKLKTTRPDTFSSGNVIWDSAVEVVANTVELGGTIADAISKGIEHIKESDWYKGLSKDKKDEVEKSFTDAFAEEKEINKDKLDELQKMLVDRSPKDNKFSIEEARAIWEYAKEQYLDRGASFRNMIAHVAEDTGLTWKQASTALTSKKTERISDEMWKASSERLKNQHATKNWIEAQNKSIPFKALRKVSAAFRGVAVFGHGGIFIGTHAGMTLFNPSQWSKVIPAFIRGWKFAYGNEAKYERRIEQLRNDPNYVKAQRAGLKNNPDNINTEEFQKSQKFFEKIGGNAGIKGFNAIKVLRQDLFNMHYDKLSEVEKNDPEAVEQIAKLVNNATGATNLKMPEWVNEVTFAGGMEATRWGKLTRNPMRATAIAFKALAQPEKATTAERVFAKVWARRVGEQLGTMAGMLLANAAIQNAVNPNNPTNLTDPDKPDFMKFKFGDLTIDPSSGMRGTSMFIYGLGKIPFMSKKELRGDTPFKYMGKSVAGYARGKLAPAYSTMADFFDQKDFNGNIMPFSDEKPSAGHHKLTWTEYLWQKAPLPIAHAAGEMYKAALDHNGGSLTTKHIIDGIIAGVLSGGTGFRIGEYNAEEANHSPYNEADKKDPTFKFFLDKGMELPNTSLNSEVVTDKKSMTKKKVSEYSKEIQDRYTETHKQFLKKELADVKKKGYVYTLEYLTGDGDKKVEVYTDKKPHSVRKNLGDLGKEELVQVLSTAQSQATRLAKKKIFNQK